MSQARIPSYLAAFAPEFSHQLGVILRALSALIARRLLRRPHLAAFILPLWRRLARTRTRIERLLARLAAGRVPTRSRSGRGGHTRQSPRFPATRGWLIAALGPEGAVYASQLATLLETPAAARILALAPKARRLLAPVARMLGIVPRAVPTPAVPATPPPRPLLSRPQAPRPVAPRGPAPQRA